MTSTPESVRYRFGRFELQPAERRLLADGSAVRLGGHALDLLIVLIEQRGHLVSKDQLLTRVWRDVIIEENTLQSHVASLRKALGQGVIATVSGQGYRFIPEVERLEVSTESRTHNFPHHLTSFIGREQEIVRIGQLMTEVRLMTLTGAGGCGKTRLALEVALRSAGAYPDGGWFVELASLRDPALISQRVGTALKLQEAAGKTMAESVTDWLSSKNTLLILDNAEHLLGGASDFVDRLLRRCARLRVLVTSRERLGIAGELTYRVPSLSFPETLASGTAAKALATESAQLFVARARLVQPDFSITDKTAPALVSICRRLDGIALAIELAAPCVRTMSLAELSEHLDDRFFVLTGGAAGGLPRHRTLRSLIDWSHDLLSDAEKVMLRRLSVFSGGWTMEAAARVCVDERIKPGDLLNLLTSLTDKNLVTVDTSGEVSRYGFLETLREYALDHLRESDDIEALREAHVDYFVSLAEALNTPQQGDDERRAKLKRLDRELANIQAALMWSGADASRSTKGLRLAGNLVYFWMTRGLLGEGRGWVDRLLSASVGDAGEDHARACNCAANLAYCQDDYDANEAYNLQALAIWNRLGERGKAAATLGNLATSYVNVGDHARACDLFEQAVKELREVGDLPRTILPLSNLGTCAYEMGDLAGAEKWLLECLPLSVEAGNWTAGGVRGQLGLVRHAQGDLHQARVLLTDSLSACKEFGDRLWTAKILIVLGVVSHDEHDCETAGSLLREAVSLLQGLQESQHLTLAEALEGYAGVVLEIGKPLQAALFWGHAQMLRVSIKAPQPIPMRRRTEGQVALARKTLQDDHAFDLAWTRGRATPSSEIIATILER